jgi:hypothetical protein
MSGKSPDYQGKADKATKNAVNALQAQSYSDPFGSFKNGVFTPTMSDTQKSTLSNTQQGIADYTNALQQPFSLNNYYNNPYYQGTLKQLSAPVNQQYQQDAVNLQNSVKASGLQGSSYDALSKNLLQQNNTYNLNQASGQARSASADAYNQLFNNNLAGLNGLNQSQLMQQQYLYQPMNMALAYQQAVSPLQTAAANNYVKQAQQYQQLAAQQGGGGTNWWQIGGAALGALAGAFVGAPVQGAQLGAAAGGAAKSQFGEGY